MNQYINSQVLESKQVANVSKLAIAKPRRDSEIDGSRFHLVMQQMGLGIPVDGLLAAHPQFRQWVNVAWTYTQIPGNKRWGVDLCHEFNGIYLIENYDFIVSNDDNTIAIDWTIGKPQDFDVVKESWKTQLRLFLLHENTGIECENISLIYLFVNSEAVYQCCYTTKQHEENKQKLGSIILPIEELQVESQTKLQNDSLIIMHEDWLAGKINIQEYFNAIPEVEL